MFGTIYAFYRYVRSPTAWRLIAVGLEVAEASHALRRSTAVSPALPDAAPAGSRRVHPTPQNPCSRTWKSAKQLAVAFLAICLIAVAVLWAFYGFRYAAREGGLYGLNQRWPACSIRFPAELRYLRPTSWPLWQSGISLPESYLYGFAHVLIQSNFFHSYLLGTIYPHSVWFYFPVAMLIKSTLTFLVLLAISKWAAATGRFRDWRRSLYLLLLPAAVYLVFAMVGGMNIGVRHVLPVYMFLSVWIAGVCWTLIQKKRAKVSSTPSPLHPLSLSGDLHCFMPTRHMFPTPSRHLEGRPTSTNTSATPAPTGLADEIP